MSTVSAPFGLRPSYHPSGVIRPTMYSIASGYAVNIYGNQPVRIAPATTGGETQGTVVAAAVGAAFIGTFSGVEWTDTDGRLRVSNKWTASTATQANTDVRAYVTLDPAIVYDIQANGSLTAASIGSQYNTTAIGTGNSSVGVSQMMLDTATSGTNAQLRVIGLTPGPDNAWGDNYTIVQVQISEHQNVANAAAY